VAAAITRVRPWGVDSLTHTNRRSEGNGFSKDPELVAAFVASARGAASA
jgi:phosphoribosylanthranilate isomerase